MASDDQHNARTCTELHAFRLQVFRKHANDSVSDRALVPLPGMADILSPFLVVYPDSDALAFMCFAAVLGQIRQNFLEGQPGVHASIQHVGSLLQRVDAKLWRQIGTHACYAHQTHC